MKSTEWMSKADCQYFDPEIFFPYLGQNSKAVEVICSSCPVRRDCIRYAVEGNIEDGTFGCSANLRGQWTPLVNRGEVDLDIAVDALEAGLPPYKALARKAKAA